MMVEAANRAELERTLLSLRDILAKYGYRDDAQVMHDLMCDWQDAKTKEDRREVAWRITTSYGGMGSLNDLYLNRGASPEVESRFQEAKRHLYYRARAFR
jgi:hypothetical protein